MTEMDPDAPTTTVEAEIRADLLERNGPLLSGSALCRALGYPTLAAMRQSITRDTFPVPTFLIEGRRGRFALTWVVARWLASRQLQAAEPRREPGRPAVSPDPSRTPRRPRTTSSPHK